MMKVSEASMSMAGMARARPDQVRKVLDQVQQLGVVTTYKKVMMNKLDSYTPLVYSLCGVVTEVGAAPFIGAGNYASLMLLPHLAGLSTVRLTHVATTKSLSAVNAQQVWLYNGVDDRGRRPQ